MLIGDDTITETWKKFCFKFETWIRFAINRKSYPFFVYGWSKFGVRGLESRQKPGKICNFCLPDSPKPGCAVLKVEQNLQNLEKCSTADSKFRARGSESRTKSQKIEKMFYSVTFAKAVCSQITGKFQKALFCP